MVVVARRWAVVDVSGRRRRWSVTAVGGRRPLVSMLQHMAALAAPVAIVAVAVARRVALVPLRGVIS